MAIKNEDVNGGHECSGHWDGGEKVEREARGGGSEAEEENHNDKKTDINHTHTSDGDSDHDYNEDNDNPCQNTMDVHIPKPEKWHRSIIIVY